MSEVLIYSRVTEIQSLEFIAMEDGRKIYEDAIHLPERIGKTADEQRQIMQDRFDNWYAQINTPQESAPEEVL